MSDFGSIVEYKDNTARFSAGFFYLYCPLCILGYKFRWDFVYINHFSINILPIAFVGFGMLFNYLINKSRTRLQHVLIRIIAFMFIPTIFWQTTLQWGWFAIVSSIIPLMYVTLKYSDDLGFLLMHFGIIGVGYISGTCIGNYFSIPEIITLVGVVIGVVACCYKLIDPHYEGTPQCPKCGRVGEYKYETHCIEATIDSNKVAHICSCKRCGYIESEYID